MSEREYWAWWKAYHAKLRANRPKNPSDRGPATIIRLDKSLAKT